MGRDAEPQAQSLQRCRNGRTPLRDGIRDETIWKIPTSVPCGFDRNGLPLGLQIVGKPWDEAAVLYTAYRYETKTGWNAKHRNI